MRERVRLMQGEFWIRSHEQKGTEIAVQVPLTRKIE
jgi:signal transduction histidine kinase